VQHKQRCDEAAAWDHKRVLDSAAPSKTRA
jgi:hypothetical protein